MTSPTTELTSPKQSPSMGHENHDSQQTETPSKSGLKNSEAVMTKTRDEASASSSEIVKFYAGKSVLISGATGFLGKVLLWKLLTTCNQLKKVYVLLRPKHGVSSEKRLHKLLSNAPFKQTFDTNELMQKVFPISCDLSAPVCEISDQEKSELINEVDIVIHSAASVRFNAPLDDNLRDNVYGTRSMLELCSQFSKLKAFVHVSTAYSNCHLLQLDELLEPLPASLDEIFKSIETLPGDKLKHPTKELMAGRPNSYTYTKAIAEHLVASYETKFPISVVRPSIVICSESEPMPGWVDNYNGICGLGSLAAVGLLRTIDWNYWATSDMVPVDHVASCIICSAYDVANDWKRKAKFFNMCSGSLNPMSWGKLFDLLRNEAVERPATKVVRPFIIPPRYNRVNQAEFLLTKFFSELLFAYFVDTILMLLGHKRLLISITKKLHQGYSMMTPFTTCEWLFKSENVIAMSDTLSDTDKQLFKFDIRKIDWHRQAKVLYEGTLKFLFKEDLSEASIAKGKQRLMIATVAHKILTFMLFATLSTLTYSSIRMLLAYV